MPGLAAYRKTTPAARDELAAEIRRRNYGDLQGLQAWLLERGVVAVKSAIGSYALKLKRADEEQPPQRFTPETVNPLETVYHDALDIMDRLEPVYPVHPVAAAALVKAQRHLISAVLDLHRAHIAEAGLHDPASPPN
jgi:hypothetical protein